MSLTNKKPVLRRICVIDGQGGGIGSAVIKKLKDLFNYDNNDVIVIGSSENKQKAINGAWAAGYTLIE